MTCIENCLRDLEKIKQKYLSKLRGNVPNYSTGTLYIPKSCLGTFKNVVIKHKSSDIELTKGNDGIYRMN
jgi:hypothetical protein